VRAKKSGTAPAGGRLRVKQVRSGIGHPPAHRATLRSIGLKHHQDVVIVTDTPSLRGMLNQVRHMIEVTPVEEAK
jgi:large subunit ribosomal protein L30